MKYRLCKIITKCKTRNIKDKKYYVIIDNASSQNFRRFATKYKRRRNKMKGILIKNEKCLHR